MGESAWWRSMYRVLSGTMTFCVLVQHYAFVEEKQKLHCLNTLFSKVNPPPPPPLLTLKPHHRRHHHHHQKRTR